MTTKPQPTAPRPLRSLLRSLIRHRRFVGVLAAMMIATALITWLLTSIFERKQEARNPFVRVVRVTEETTDPAEWGKNWPQEYDSTLRTAESTRTRFGGHGGSEALPDQKIERDPWLKRMFAGYAFSIDYRDPPRPRLHAVRSVGNRAGQPGARSPGRAFHCHASIVPTWRRLGMAATGQSGAVRRARGAQHAGRHEGL